MVEAFKMKDLLEAGAHFGHQAHRWNPKMKKFIYTKRGGIHVINLQQTVIYANRTYEIVREMAKEGKKILFVCTKKQGNMSVKEAALSCGMPYIISRWLGGLLTNRDGILNSIKKYRRYSRMEVDGSFEKLTKKEVSRILKKKQKIEKVLGGIIDMDGLPGAIFVVDTVKEKLAVLEARKCGVPVIALVDTNSDPDLIDYPIPANDDAIRAVKFFASKIAEAVIEGLAVANEGYSQNEDNKEIENTHMNEEIHSDQVGEEE